MVSVTISATVTEVMRYRSLNTVSRVRMQVLAEHDADGGNAGEAHAGPHLLHHVQAGAKRRAETNQRHHQHHMIAEVVDNQLHHQDIKAGQHHPTTRQIELITAPR